MMDEPQMVCQDDRRRAALREDGRLNGIDYIEVETSDAGKPELHVFLLGSLPPNDRLPWLDESNITITGRGPGPQLTIDGEITHHPAADDERDDWIVIPLNTTGERSSYLLHLEGTAEHPIDDLDPRYATAPFSFAPDTPVELDCLDSSACLSESSSVPDLNYLAKDYSSFRQLLLDRLAVTLPGWRDHHSPDLYLTIVEVLAYHADLLSYAQDAVTTEAYLDTARLRTSVRRHARLVDYFMHEGCNARAWVCLEVDGNPSVRADQIQFLTRPNGVPSDAVVLLPDRISDDARSSYEVFEPLPEMGWEEVAESDITRPREMAERLLSEGGAAINAIRAILRDDIRAELQRAVEADDLSRLRAVLAQLVRDLLDDLGFAVAGGGLAVASQRYGTPNALRGPALRRHNRCKVQDIFTEEILQPARYRFHEAHNRIPFYTWQQAECCLPKGTTSTTLLDRWLDENKHRRALENLQTGDVLILEELANPWTGNSADVDPSHRHAVRLTSVDPAVDPLGDVPVVEIAWDAVDALPFALTLSAIGPPPECRLLEDVSVARGNVVLVDHGETVREPDPARLLDGARIFLAVPFEPPDDIVPAQDVELCCVGERRVAERPIQSELYRPRLAEYPLVFAEPLTIVRKPASRVLCQDPRQARPQVALFSPIDHPRPWMDVLERQPDTSMVRAQASFYERWHPRPDLLGSDADDRHFVVEVDDRGISHIRFGDGELGARPVADTRYLAWYRVGGGPAGNVGREAISRLLLRGEIRGGEIVLIRNPLPARGGTAPERVAEVRLLAPHAFRTILQRAITLEDYAAIAIREFPDRVQRAAARVTGTDDNRTQIALTLDLLGGNADDPDFRDAVEQHMGQFRRIGHVLDVAQVAYVFIELAIEVTLTPHHQRGAVLRALRDRFSNTVRSGGSLGFFHPDALTFGQNIPLSMIVAAALEIPGVARVTVLKLRRVGPVTVDNPMMPVNDLLEIKEWEIARLDNNPYLPANGVLTLTTEATP